MSVARLRELLVLGAIRVHATHGYALAEALEVGLGRAIGLTRSNLYALLQRMENKGWITHHEVKDSGYPTRRIYSVTAAGESSFQRVVGDGWQLQSRTVLPLVILIAYLDEVPLDRQLGLLQTMRERLCQELASLRAFPTHEGSGGAALHLLTRHVEVDLEALDRLIQERTETA